MTFDEKGSDAEVSRLTTLAGSNKLKLKFKNNLQQTAAKAGYQL